MSTEEYAPLRGDYINAYNKKAGLSFYGTVTEVTKYVVVIDCGQDVDMGAHLGRTAWKFIPAVLPVD